MRTRIDTALWKFSLGQVFRQEKVLGFTEKNYSLLALQNFRQECPASQVEILCIRPIFLEAVTDYVKVLKCLCINLIFIEGLCFNGEEQRKGM